MSWLMLYNDMKEKKNTSNEDFYLTVLMTDLIWDLSFVISFTKYSHEYKLPESLQILISTVV
jgi:hypothetical protein